MKEALLKISNLLILLENQVSDIGLIEGKMGVAIFLYHSSRVLKSKVYEDAADNILDTVFGGFNSYVDTSFTNGLSGIGYGLNHLIKYKFIDADPDDLFIDVDNKIFSTLESNTHNFGGNTPLFLGIYIFDRLNNLDENPIFKSIFVRCKNFCESTYNEKFQFDEKTLLYLNSILYFLISIHEKGYYNKTIELLIYNILVGLIDSINKNTDFTSNILVTISLLSRIDICSTLSAELKNKVEKMLLNKEQHNKKGIDIELILQQLLFLETKIEIDLVELNLWMEEKLNTILEQNINTLSKELSIIGLSIIRNNRAELLS